MGRHRKPARREANPRRGSDYTEAVIEFMDTRGYICTNRAEISGSRDDLEFKPKVNGRPIIAEAKHIREDQDGFSPNDYKQGFAEYFLKWVREPELQYHFFVSEESNPRLWDQLFDEEPDSDEVHTFFEKIEDAVDDEVGEELSQYEEETFEEFAADTTVWNYTLAELELETDRGERTGNFDYEPYHTEYPVIEDRDGNLSTNLFEITEFPTTLYRMSIEDGVSTSSFYDQRENRFAPVELDDGHLYSFLSESELPEATQGVVDGTTEEITTVEFVQSLEGDEVNLIKSLLKGLLTLVANESGVTVDERRDGAVTVAYFSHTDAGTRGEKKVGQRWVAKEANSHPVVRHRAVEIKLKRFADDFYYVLIPKQEYTTDGETLVSSDRKNELTSDFSKSSYPQNDRTRKNLEMWADILNPGDSILRFGNPYTAIRELQFDHVGGITVECRPPKDSNERKELIEGL